MLPFFGTLPVLPSGLGLLLSLLILQYYWYPFSNFLATALASATVLREELVSVSPLISSPQHYAI